jgi:hypothetical protein
MRNPIFPVIIGPPGSTYFDAETGLTLPGAPQTGTLQVAIQYTIEAEDPIDLTIQTHYLWFDLCTSGAPDCPDPDLEQDTPIAASVDIVTPDIQIVKTSDLGDDPRICDGVDTEVTYTYTVTNIGDVDLENVDVSDNMCSPVDFVGGDTDGDMELDLSETWIYECTTTINSETTNTATVTAQAVNTPQFCAADDTDQLTITTNDNPVVTALGDDVCPEEMGELCASASGSRAPYTIQWLDPSGGSAGGCSGLLDDEPCCIPATMIGTYTAVATDDNGCSGEDTANLIENEEPVVTVDREQVDICFGEDTTFTATVTGGASPYDVIWTDEGGNTLESCLGIEEGEPCELTVDATGTYTATATDDNGCIGSDEGVLIVNPAKVVTVVRPSGSICEGEDFEFCASAAGGTPPYSIEWFDPLGNSIEFCSGLGEGEDCCVTVDTPGTYTAVAVDDNDCTDSDTGELSETGNPLVDLTPRSPEICDGDTQMLCAEVSGGTPPYTVRWFDPLGNEIDMCADVGENEQCCTTVSEPGEYCAVAVDSEDCEGMNCVILTVHDNPIVTADDVEICEGDPGTLCASAAGGRAPYAIDWFDSLGNSIGGCTGLAENEDCCVPASAADTYTAEATDDNDCFGEDDAVLTVAENPVCTIIPPIGNPECGSTGNTLTADVVGGRMPYVYDWSVSGTGWQITGGDGTATITYTAGSDPLVPGFFQLMVTDANDCVTDCDLEVFCDPPQGGEGCTPGYWKQPHHFDDWTAPYDPGDLFSAHFDDAFSGKTLLTVLSQPASSPPGPNQLNSLGRHTVAALLNAASDGVSFDFTVQEVINLFNDTYPGTIAEYNALKNQFASANESGCFLNGNADVNGDGLVNTEDLLIVFSNWGSTGPGDVDENGVVDTGDVMMVVAYWGS